MDNAIRKRKLKIVLSGHLGNLGLSYDGIELLPELFRNGRWLRLWREAAALTAARQLRWRGVLARIFAPWSPPALWVWINKIARGYAPDAGDFTAIHPRRLGELDLSVRATAQFRALSYRRWKDSFGMRLHALQTMDPGNYQKGALAGVQVDYRDPTSDVRLLEFCLAVPTEQFLHNGTLRSLARRAVADRLPKQVLEESRRGFQVADWHEDLTASRDHVFAELDRLETCPAAAAVLDLPRLRQLTENWPSSGWERKEIELPYRYTLLRAIAVGHFLRRATGSNC